MKIKPQPRVAKTADAQSAPLAQSADSPTRVPGDRSSAQAVELRELDAEIREGEATTREKSATLREEGVALREGGVDLREKGVGLRESGLGLREKGVGLREEGATQREEGASSRERGAGRREEASQVVEQDLARTLGLMKQQLEELREANAQLIQASVRAHSRTDAAESEAAEVTHQAEHDFLTGLPNRSLLLDRAVQALALAARHKTLAALLFIDLDHFKPINDTLGHAVGDKLLLSVAERLLASVRASDTVSRQGGDEFVVLLPEIDNPQSVAVIADKLIKAVGKPHFIDGHKLRVTLSVGVAIYPHAGADVDALLRNADNAMYEAKHGGRNKFTVFAAGMLDTNPLVETATQALEKALLLNQFVLHYQPQVDLQTGKVTGAEALVRWETGRPPPHPPSEFVPVAEHSGLILRLGAWVLREACRQMQAWLHAGLEIDHMAVNVSAVEFHDERFLPALTVILQETGLNPHFLELELTESVLLRDAESSVTLLRELRKLGVRIAVDDFGTGYASLGYLQRFPVDTLKIDQSFVQDLDREAGSAIVGALISMGNNLGLHVVAEGIETSHQLHFLQERNCAEGQGFYFGRAVPADEFAAQLRTPC